MAFSWIPFYEELADKLLTFKNDRPAMIAKVREAHEIAGKFADVSLPTIEHDNANVPDLDPFTVFALFNRNLGDEKRKAVCKGYKEVFSIAAAVPEDFEGVPVQNFTKYCFYPYLDDPKRHDDDFDVLWALYEAALQYAQNQGAEEEKRFSDLLDRGRKVQNVDTPKLSIALFHIRPSFFISLDRNNVELLYKNGLTVAKGEISGADYCRFLHTARKNLLDSQKYDSFAAFSAAAYSGNLSDKKSETERTLAEVGLSKEDPDNMRYVDAICRALREIGRPAAPKEIYEKMLELEIPTGIAEKNTGNNSVRATIYNHSSDALGFTFNDIFKKVSYGVWWFKGEEIPEDSPIPHAPIGEEEWDDEGEATCEVEIEDVPMQNNSPYDYSDAVSGGVNMIVYGTPGCGKSQYVKRTILHEGEDVPEAFRKENIFRITFHQDYSYSDFVGQITPSVQYDAEDSSKSRVEYRFVPGPFTLALERAIAHPEEKVALVIEEINRGSAPAIFGDLFQLLDRLNEEQDSLPIGTSEYEIKSTALLDYLCDNDPAHYSKKEQYIFEQQAIRIPANMYLYATMNTGDQNVFTLDTAFKRRWKPIKIRNKFDSGNMYDKELRNLKVPGLSDVTWEQFVTGINAQMNTCGGEFYTEDKQLGKYFVDKQLLLSDSDSEEQRDEKAERFAYKVLEYLWNDVAKFNKPDWFNEDIKDFDTLVDRFRDGKTVFSFSLT